MKVESRTMSSTNLLAVVVLVIDVEVVASPRQNVQWWEVLCSECGVGTKTSERVLATAAVTERWSKGKRV